MAWNMNCHLYHARRDARSFLHPNSVTVSFSREKLMAQALRFVFFNQRGLRAGWRLLIFLLIFGLLSSVLLVSSRLLAKHPGRVAMLTPGLIVFNDGSTFLLLLFAAWIMSRIERRPMAVYGLPLKDQPVFSRLATGYIFWGFLTLSVVLVTLRFFGAFSFGNLALHGPQIWLYGLAWFLAFLLVGFSEEYLLRGYALYTLADGIGFWPATIVLGVLFGLGHAANPGETRIGVMATVVFALFASVTLRVTGSLWLAVGAHAGWDWGQSFFYGVSDSGLTAEGHLLNPSFHGPVWLTGGSVGPEGSAVTLIVWSALMLLVYLVYHKRKQPVLVIEPGTAPPGAARL
jgi:membrane protease YdiL (CAAX protease family)